MQNDKDPMMSAIQASLQEKAGPEFEVRQVLRMGPLATDVLLHSSERGLFRARIYNVKEKDFNSFRESWDSHGRLITQVNHPQIKSLLTLEAIGKTLALTGPVPSGIDLATYCRKVGPLQPAFATRMLLKIVQLYQALYEQGGHNLNLRLENLYLCANGEIHLANYGLWNFEVELADLWGMKELLDPSFLSPEHLTNKTLTVSSEIYQLGILYYRLVTGEFPFTGEYEDVRDAHLSQPPANPQATRDDISVGLIRILAKALAKKPNERFWTLADFQQTLCLLLPLEERPNYTEVPSEDITDADRQRFEEQLGQANDLFKEGDFDAALHTVGAVLMMAGNYKPAIDLAFEIRAGKNQVQIKKYWDDARYILDMGQPESALDPLHRILDLDPNHEQTQQLQAQLFQVMEDSQPDLGRQIPVQAYMEHAGTAKTLEDYTLAENLWYMVLLTPSPTESHLFELMQMQKKVARQELATLSALHQGVAKLPESQDANPEQSSSSFRDDELEELFAPISPNADPVNDLEVEDELFDDLSYALGDDPLDITSDQPLDQLLDGPDPSLTADTKPIAPPPPQKKPPVPPPKAAKTPPPVVKKPAAPPPKPPPVSAKPATPPPGPKPKPTPPPAEKPPAAQVHKDKPKKKKSPLPLILGGVAALIVIAAGVFVLMRMNAAKAYRKAGNDAYDRADTIESSGDWQAALAAWRKAETDYPEFRDIPERVKTLEYKIQKREEDIARYTQKAREFLDQENYYGNGTQNAVAMLRQILTLDESHAEAKAMFQELTDLEMARAHELFDQEKVVEARGIYDTLVSSVPDFSDPEFEAEMDQWIEDKVVGPQLEKIDRAIKRKRWDQALELTEALRQTLKNPAPLNERWNSVYAEFETKLQEAEAKGNKSQMLSQIEMMARIRPDDTSLIERRNLLNREINQSKISDLERSVEDALKSKSYTKAGRYAYQLERLDSENGLAKSALEEVRNHYLRRVRSNQNSDARAAYEAYKDLISVFNWKSYRKEMDALGNRIGEFDRQLAALEKGNNQSYDQQIANAVRMSEQFSDFSQDAAFPRIAKIKDQLIDEQNRLKSMMEWEQSVRNNPSKSYDEVLANLKKAGPFTRSYGKSQKQKLVSRYQDLNENYQGAVTLVIRSAKSLPKESSGLNKAPEAFCELTIGGKTFTTGVVNNEHNPTWDYTCNISVQAGQSLTFSVYDSERGNKKDLLGTIGLAKIPKTTRGLVLKHKDGWSIAIDVRRER